MGMISTILTAAVLGACSGGGGGGGGGVASTQPGGGGGNNGGGDIAGCTDPSADNYDSSATIDDGSCTYVNGGGSSAYSGYNTASGAEVVNRAEGSLDSAALKVSGYFAADTNSTKMMTNNADMLVYGSSCIGENGDAFNRVFNVVMVGSPGTSSTKPTIATLTRAG